MRDATKVTVSTPVEPAVTGNMPHGTPQDPGTLFIGNAADWHATTVPAEGGNAVAGDTPPSSGP